MNVCRLLVAAARAALPQLLQHTEQVSACHTFTLRITICFTANDLHQSPILMPSYDALSGLTGLCTCHSTMFTAG